MNIINDKQKLDNYIKKYQLESFFTDFSQCYPHLTLAEFPANTFIYTGEEFSGYIYFFVEGRYKVYGNLYNGRRILYRFCHAFSVIGEMEFMLGSGARADNSVETVERCVAVLLDYRAIRQSLASDAKFLHYMCQVFAEKLEYFGNMQMVNSCQSAQEKVAVYLLNAADANGIFCENQRIVAEQLNISYRHLHRVLRRFVEQGSLTRIRQGYRITDRERLEQASL